MTELRLRGIGKRFGSVVALAGIDLVAAPGTRTAVVGPSGSGKSTLLRLIAGFEVPDAGEILLDGVLVASPAASVPAHLRNVGLVIQDGALFPHLSVLDNVRFGMEHRRGDDGRRALELLDLVELDRGMAARQPHELSGGQQQRVALARALARRPALMLLDEPFSALDAGLREQMRNATAAILARAGITTLLVTHDQTEAMEFADQIVVLRDGRLCQAGPPGEVYRAPVDRETAEFLGEAIILDAVIRDGIAACSLGRVKVDAARDGPATIMLRPEQVVVRPADTPAVNGSAVAGRVLASTLVGPRASILLHMDADEDRLGHAPLLLRTSGPVIPAVGSAVAVTVLGSAHVFDTARR